MSGGGIVVGAGAAFDVESSTVSGSVTAVAASTVRLCGSGVGGAVTVTASGGFVLVGDADDDGCPPNQIGGSLNLSLNHHGLGALWNKAPGSSSSTT